MERSEPKKFLNWITLIVLALVWGSSFILMKRGLDAFSSSQVAAIRIFVAGLFISPLAFKHLKKEFRSHWKSFLGMGALGNLIPAFLFTKAETGISSSLTGILNSLTPLFTVLIGAVFFKVKSRWQNIIGVLIGLCGAVGLLAGSGVQAQAGGHPVYGLYVVLATCFYAISVNIIARDLKNVNPVTATVWALLMICPIAGIYLFTTDFLTVLQTKPNAWSSLGYVTILAVFGTALSVIVFNMLIRNSSAVFATSVTYLIPIVALIWGIFDGEGVNWMHFMWIGVILGGVYLVNRK